MTETELNEYLAKAACFTHVERYGFDMWHDSEGLWSTSPPDFCHSLDVCVKWLGPLFGVKELRYYDHYRPGTGEFVWEWEVRLLFLHDPNGYFAAWDANPALAFCRAAERALEQGTRAAEQAMDAGAKP